MTRPGIACVDTRLELTVELYPAAVAGCCQHVDHTSVGQYNLHVDAPCSIIAIPKEGSISILGGKHRGRLFSLHDVFVVRGFLVW